MSNVNMYLLFVLLFADDLVIFALTVIELQRMINHLKYYYNILFKINLAFVLYWSVHPHRLFYFIF